MTSPAVSLAEISKRYPEQKEGLALKKITLQIQEGEFFCFVGPSGCGKSTLLKIVAGIEKSNQGEVKREGDISMVFQSGALLPWQNALDNAAFGLKMKGVSKNDAFSKASYYLEMMGLKEYFKKYPRELSGGQRQRVGIARALALETPILLLDEPFSALDLLTTRELHEDLLKIWQQTGKTILMVSHSPEEAVFLADRIAFMNQGEIKEIIPVQIDRPREEKSPQVLHLIEKIDFGFKQTIAG